MDITKNAMLLALLLAAPLAHAEDGDAHEVTVKVADLPAPVTSAVRAKWAGATISEAEKQADGSFELDVASKDGQKLEVVVKADGTIVKSGKDDDEGEHEGKDDDDAGHEDDD
jgi:Protein of unknown function (DUF2874).